MKLLERCEKLMKANKLRLEGLDLRNNKKKRHLKYTIFTSKSFFLKRKDSIRLKIL